MDKLQISQEYKFQKGGNKFYISEGENLKVKVSSGEVYQGTLIHVGGISECFDIETLNSEIITIDCENVIEIMPI